MGVALEPKAHRGSARPLREHVGRLRHDLGKYAVLQARWLEAGATGEDRRLAAVADLLETRRGPDAIEGAVAIWARLRPGVVGEAPLADGQPCDLLRDHPSVASLDSAVAEVAAVASEIRSAGVEPAWVERALCAGEQIAAACKALAAASRELEG